MNKLIIIAIFLFTVTSNLDVIANNFTRTIVITDGCIFSAYG